MRSVTKGCILVNIVAVIVLLVGCDSNPAVPTPPPTELSNADLLNQAIANMKALKSYHVEYSYSGGIFGEAISEDVDVANQRISLQTHESSMGGSHYDGEMINIAGKWYGRNDEKGEAVYYTGGDCDGLNVYVPLLGDSYGFADFWDKFSPVMLDKAASTIKDGSPPFGQADGVPTRHLTISAVELPPPFVYVTDTASLADIKVDLWVSSDATPTVREINYTFPQDPNSVYGIGHDTLSWSKFNQPLGIAPPTPVATCPPFVTEPPGTPYIIPTEVPTPTG
jgi:hypothetical protein